MKESKSYICDQLCGEIEAWLIRNSMKLAGGQGSINETSIPVKISNELPVNKYC
jgi:hypothetical protein